MGTPTCSSPSITISVPDNLKETWQYERKKNYYSDRFSGYAIFVSNDNADRAGSLAFGQTATKAVAAVTAKVLRLSRWRGRTS